MVQITKAQQDALAKVARRHVGSLKRKANVVDVGIGYRYRNGKRTDELAVVVRVDEKVALTRLRKTDRVPRSVGGVRTDVRERKVELLAGPYDRHDPVVGGIAIGTPRSSGTLGCIVFDKTSARPYGLTNHHVMFRPSMPEPPWYVVQPIEDTPLDDYLGEYVRADEATDSCLFTLDMGYAGPRKLDTGILQSVSAPSSGIQYPVLGMPVQKSGAKSGLTHGSVSYIGFVDRSIEVTVNRRRTPGASGFCAPGDSGAVVTESATGAVIALLNARIGPRGHWGGTAIAIDAVTDALECFVFDRDQGVWTPTSAWIGGTHMAFTIVHPNAYATLSVRYPSGRLSTAEGLGRKRADRNGMITWRWVVGTSTQRRPARKGEVRLKVGDKTYRASFDLDGTTQYDG